jgi:NAD(P)-dependent dehydrogenase (short-subunit alcohol dehydrogenase family)
MTPFHLHNKTFLVTGASSGIGRQVAVSICEMGGSVVITGRSEERLAETFSMLKSGSNKSIKAELLDDAEMQQLSDQLPMLDGIVNCAGTVNPFPVKFISGKKIDEVFDINYKVQVVLTAQITRLKKLNKGASVIFLSSISALHPHRGGALYAGSKAAIEAFSKVVALEFFHLQVRSNCIAPAMVKTPMYDKAEAQGTKEQMDAHISKYPLGAGTPEDVANAAVFLLSDASRWITGTTITLDGGFLLGGL